MGDWSASLVKELRETDAVVALDPKGRYHGTVGDGDADPALYERLIAAFPDAVLEDPAVTDETEPLLAPVASRLSWDTPITGVESVESLPFASRRPNVKPSRFGGVESTLATIEWATARDVQLYGGGQFELGVGREHVQTFASLFSPDGPNVVAPGVYNDPDLPETLPAGPLVPGDARGLSFRSRT